MSNDPLAASLLRSLRLGRCEGDTNAITAASNARYFAMEEPSLRKASPRRFSLLCHDTRTRVVVGSQGIREQDMIPSITSDGALAAFCAFLMHNRRWALYLHIESLAVPSGYADYFEFSAWAQEPPPA